MIGVYLVQGGCWKLFGQSDLTVGVYDVVKQTGHNSVGYVNRLQQFPAIETT
tara:strand:+ start:223 stop:378 length:156 start_codon:yes stop_codon:yes gene_type:complete